MKNISFVGSITELFRGLWNSFVAIFPGIVAAIIIVIIGWIVGKIAGGMLKKALKAFGLDRRIKNAKLEDALYGLKFSDLLGSLLKWYVIVIFLAAAAERVALTPMVAILDRIIPLLPGILGGIFIIAVGLLIGEFVKKSTIGVKKIPFKKVIGSALKFGTVYLAAVIALETTGFSAAILRYAFLLGFGAFVIAAAIIIGISFGLALKDDAKKIIADLRKETKTKEILEDMENEAEEKE
ncbi:hypothetical protein AKJ56_01585 [candidate division MSBL1 archaeon SCGC-AAA382N08]|uniref:Uncharacterized protein n=1 Tax=candidate division MSBL1 archaeon SCGC-AAA382N08 TaxID=1698285 RepID=A0A133VPE1_9EURY|nr:hypothetical protein AKJ56_01585 [candidate division MSBL1 archaeon SCGC-AAA382N08]